MDSILSHYKKDKFLYIFLCLSIACVMMLIANAGATIKQTGKFTAVLELLFIIGYLTTSKHTLQLQRVFDNTIVKLLLIIWIVFFASSYLILINTLELENTEFRNLNYRHLFVIIHILYFVCVSSFITTSKIDPKFLLFTISLCTLLMFIGICFLTYTMPQRTFAEWLQSPPFSGHIRGIGWMASASLMACLSIFLQSPEPIKKSIPLILFIVSSTSLLIWTGGRSAIFSSFLCSLYLIVITTIHQHPFLIKKLFIAILTLSLGVIIGQGVSPAEEGGIKRTIETLQNSTDAHIDTATTGRANMWLMSVKEIRSSPWFGSGLDSYTRIPQDLYGSQPHNFIIQFLLDWGFIGSLPLFLLLGFTLICALKYTWKKSASPNKMAAAMIIIILTLNGLVSGTYYHSQGLFLLILALALFHSHQKQ